MPRDLQQAVLDLINRVSALEAEIEGVKEDAWHERPDVIGGDGARANWSGRVFSAGTEYTSGYGATKSQYLKVPLDGSQPTYITAAAYAALTADDWAENEYYYLPETFGDIHETRA